VSQMVEHHYLGEASLPHVGPSPGTPVILSERCESGRRTISVSEGSRLKQAGMGRYIEILRRWIHRYRGESNRSSG